MTLTKILAAGTIFLALISISANAHQGATGIVMDRMMVMEDIGKSMKALGAMMNGNQPYVPEKVRDLAARIRAQGGGELTKMFPEGNTDKGSRALPAVWERRAEFETIAKQFQEHASALEKTSGSEPQAKVAFKLLANTCGTCHDTFRRPK